MDAEQEKWLRERLEEGVEVKELFPHEYCKAKLYYELYIYSPKVKVIVVIEKDPLLQEMTMKIVNVFKINTAERELVTSSLIGETITYKPIISSLNKNVSNYCLVGKLFLQKRGEAV